MTTQLHILKFFREEILKIFLHWRLKKNRISINHNLVLRYGICLNYGPKASRFSYEYNDMEKSVYEECILPLHRRLQFVNFPCFILIPTIVIFFLYTSNTWSQNTRLILKFSSDLGSRVTEVYAMCAVWGFRSCVSVYPGPTIITPVDKVKWPNHRSHLQPFFLIFSRDCRPRLIPTPIPRIPYAAPQGVAAATA